MSSQAQEAKLSPSQISVAIENIIPTLLSVFIWGPPGVAKSSVLRQIARRRKMGFADVRLSQMDPTDLRGIPIHVFENGVHGVKWSAPLILPRDLSFNVVTELLAEDTPIRFDNPHNAVPEITVSYIRKPTDPEGLRLEILNHATQAQIDKEDGDDKDKTDILSRVTYTDKQGSTTVRIVGRDGFTVRLVDENNEHHPGTIRWTVSGEVHAILALEEFNSALPSVQAAAYQLVLDRALGEYEVPKHVFIAALGNRETDKGVTYRMPTPIMNRFSHLNMSEGGAGFFDDWQTWAGGANVNPAVIGYLSANKGEIFQFNPATASKAFATPRSWEFVSKMLNQQDKATKPMPEALLTAVLSGMIGDALAIKFIAFRKLVHDLPNLDDVLNGTIKKLDTTAEIGLAYAITTSLCYELRDRNERIINDGEKPEDRERWYSQASNYIKFMMENFPKDVCIMGARQSIMTHDLPFSPRKMPIFLEFSKANRKYILVE